MDNPEQNLIKVPFNNQEIVAIINDGIPYVAMKPICENMGLDWEAQRQRMERDSVLSTTTCMIKAVADDGKQREVVALPLEYLNGWLFGIDDSRDNIYVASVAELKGCMSHGSNVIEAAKNIQEALECYLESMIDDNEEIPEPTIQIKEV